MTISIHRENAHLHNTLHALAASDAEVKARFMAFETKITLQIPRRLRELGVEVEDMEEKVHIAMNEIQSFAHEFVYDEHEYLDYAKMRLSVERMVSGLFAEE